MTTWTAESILALRKARGLTQEAMARELGVTTSAVSFWEQGRRRPVGLSVKALDGLRRKRRVE